MRQNSHNGKKKARETRIPTGVTIGLKSAKRPIGTNHAHRPPTPHSPQRGGMVTRGGGGKHMGTHKIARPHMTIHINVS